MTATQALELLFLIAGSCGIATLARRLDFAAPILLVVAGLAASYIPGVPEFRLSPDFVLLGVGLVLFTAAVVAGTVRLLVPGLPLAAALALGAILAPTDAVSAASIGRRLHLPRRLLTVITGESMLNDGTALTVYKVAVSAAAGTAT